MAADDNTVTQKNVPVQFLVTANDNFGQDGPNLGSITITNQGLNGTDVVDDGESLADSSDDAIVYTPNSGYLGKDTITYEICDANGDCDEALFVITIEVYCEPDYTNDNSLIGTTSANLITDYEAV